jgi:glycosyltransferase involved in cell wall biosynthesis
MRILMIAPEPFFEPRGTPFSQYHRIRALADLGHTVDLVTYPFGSDVALPGLRVFRCVRPPFVRRVRIGPSWAKVALDLALAFTALRRVLAERYDVVHSHEEGAAIGVVLARFIRRPHLYDMHSSLPQQLENFSFSRSRALKAAFSWLERVVVRRSRVVIVICPHLAETVKGILPSADPILIENAPGSGDAPSAGSGVRVRSEFGLGPETPLVVYTGTFEAYQGLDLLFDAAARVRQARPDARFLLAGGRPEQVQAARALARRAGVEAETIFAGERPASEIPLFLDAADVLVSPRSTGTNTPLKIYQYLRAGRPIVATRLLTHTQVLDDEVAVLTDPTPEGLATGVLEALGNPALAASVGRRAKQLAERKYSYAAYVERTRRAVSALHDSETLAATAGGLS